MATLVTGADGFVGRALREAAPDAVYVSRRDADLSRPDKVRDLFEKVRPDAVVHLAAEVGGVRENSRRNADFFADNVQINVNVLRQAQEFRVPRLISLLSSCAYPDLSGSRPVSEGDLLAGLPFKSNLGYGYAKRMLGLHAALIAEQYGLRWTTLTPATLFGPHDNFDPETGHVVGALVRKAVAAKRSGTPLEVWGGGEAVRQFLYVRDLARLLVRALKEPLPAENIIVVPDEGVTIGRLASEVAGAVGFKGPIVFNPAKPEGQKVRVLRSERFAAAFPGFVFTPRSKALEETAAWFERNAPEGAVS